jgi:hypothetical protein
MNKLTKPIKKWKIRGIKTILHPNKPKRVKRTNTIAGRKSITGTLGTNRGPK